MCHCSNLNGNMLIEVVFNSLSLSVKRVFLAIRVKFEHLFNIRYLIEVAFITFDTT